MWLYLDLDGINFHFRISDYQKSTKTNYYDQWCKIDLTLQSENWLDYKISSSILLSYEVEILRNKLSALLFNKIKSTEELDFIEPDLSFVLNPQKDLTLDPNYTYVAPGHEIADIVTDLRVHLWDAGITENYISLCFDREDIEALYFYLSLLTKQIKEDDPSIKKYIESDIIRVYNK